MWRDEFGLERILHSADVRLTFQSQSAIFLVVNIILVLAFLPAFNIVGNFDSRCRDKAIWRGPVESRR